MFPSYYYLVQQAKDDSFSVSDACAILAIIISIVSPFIASYFNKRQGVKETFWMREVLIPQFTEALFNFMKESPEKFRARSSLGDFYQNYALEVMNSLRASSLILGIASASMMTEIQEHIGSFEDDVMLITTSDEYILLISDFSRNIVRSIQKAQFGA